MIDSSFSLYSIKSKFNNDRNKIVSVDFDRYKKLLEDSSYSDAEKDEFLKALWSIISTFIDLGFGVHPLQAASENGRQPIDIKQDFDGAGSADVTDEFGRDGCLIDSREEP